MNTFVQDVLKSVATGATLNATEAEEFMNRLMSGETSPAQTGALLAAMAVRGEKPAEIVGFARAMRRHSVRLDVPLPVVDTCGTGGDGAATFNISTGAAIVAAAAGVPIAKHGNRAVSSHSGSADVLQALGARIDLDDRAARACLLETNLCFLFAQAYHPAMKHAAEPRKQLGFRTIFNILGPLTNPAGARRQVIGVFRPDLVRIVADALVELGTDHALVVHGEGGIDELSLAGPTQVAEVKDGEVRTYTVTPESCGLQPAPITAISGGDAQTNATILQAVLTGARGPQRDVVALNAGAALYVSGQVGTLAEGVRLAASMLDNRSAYQTLQSFVRATRAYSPAEAEVAQ